MFAESIRSRDLANTVLGWWNKHAKFFRCLLAGILSQGGGQIIRLAGNLILTRLLVPEAFGMMALINVFLAGLEMFSDIGIGASIVHRKKEPDSMFLQSAWTLQVLRGFVLFIIACLATYPLAVFYEEPLLAVILPISSIALLISGFRSTAPHLCARHLKLGALTRIELSAAGIGLIVSIGIALYHVSVWGLVIGGLVTAVSHLVASWYFLPEQTRHRFCWHRESLSELVHFGKWIFLSTVFGFLAINADRLILGKFLTLEQLGIYTVAFFFSQAVSQFMGGIAARVLFPLFSRLNDDSLVRRYRRFLLGGALVPISTFLIGGPLIISLLYDDRYLAAGGMVQILSLSAAAATLRVMAEPVLLSKGDSFSRMILSLCEAISIILCLLIGGILYGLPGFLIGFVFGQFLTLLPTAILLKKHKLWLWDDDLKFLLLIGAVAWIGFTLHNPLAALSL